MTQLSKFKKFQSQISEDFTKQFSVLEKLLDEFTTGEDYKLFGNKVMKKFSFFRDKEVNSGREKGTGQQLPGQQ